VPGLVEGVPFVARISARSGSAEVGWGVGVRRGVAFDLQNDVRSEVRIPIDVESLGGRLFDMSCPLRSAGGIPVNEFVALLYSGASVHRKIASWSSPQNLFNGISALRHFLVKQQKRWDSRSLVLKLEA